MPQRKKKPFWKMTHAERDKAVKEFEREISFEETRPLSPRNKALWERARRGVGAPGGGKNSKAVVVALDQKLLARSDEYAKRLGLSRSELIQRALKTVLPKRKSA